MNGIELVHATALNLFLPVGFQIEDDPQHAPDQETDPGCRRQIGRHSRNQQQSDEDQREEGTRKG